ncbi:hypothetical protein EV426DRAFT_707275 [Tirmania nivea]|nr:hypothetical protein EV426DRAFT_707275 [Tirmania nivea]
MSNKQQPTEPSLAVIIGSAESSRRPAGRKRKTIGLPDIPSREVGNNPSQGLSLRRLAKRPTPDTQQPNRIGQSRSSSIGAAAGSGILADTETRQALPFQPSITPVRMEHILGNSLGHLPTNNAPSGLIPLYEDTRISSDSVGGGEALFDLNNPAPYSWSGMLSINYPCQSFDLGDTGAQVDIPSEEVVGINFGGKLSDQKWGSSGSSLVACPWRSHLERIMSLAMAISQISRKFKSATIQPLCEVDVERVLEQLEYLQESYFKLQECVQSSMPSGGA